MNAVFLWLLLSVSSTAGPVASLDTESYLGSTKSWGIIRFGFLQIMPQRIKEMEGSMPGRFIPRADVAVLDRMEKGHFLKVTCEAGTPKAFPCPDRRTLLEARVMAAVFLEAAPKTRKLDELVDPETWALTPLGRTTIERAEAKCPDFWQRLAKMTAEVVGTRP